MGCVKARFFLKQVASEFAQEVWSPCRDDVRNVPKSEINWSARSIVDYCQLEDGRPVEIEYQSSCTVDSFAMGVKSSSSRVSNPEKVYEAHLFGVLIAEG